MKKSLKWIGIGIAILFVIGLIGTSGNKSNSIKDAFNQGKEDAKQDLFTKDIASKKIQDYELQVELKSPTIPKGTTILEAYEIRGKVPAIKNLGWNVTENIQGVYTVSFKEQIGDLVTEATWEVTKDTIKALNGTALVYTPELGEQPNEVQGSDLEKQIYSTLLELLEKYPNTSVEEQDASEIRAVSETATKYKITTDKVRDIFTKLDATRYN
ncbi:MAG: hypothetical protein WC220_05535 [Pedobacter sp.]|jgi:hypothetical protein